MLPEQNLTTLRASGVYYPGQWGAPYVPLRYFEDDKNATMYVAMYNQFLSAGAPSRLLSNFAGICQVLMADMTADQALDHSLITRLLDMPTLARLHTQLTYITELCDYLRRHLQAKEIVTGATNAAQTHFVDALETELLRRRVATVAAVQGAT